jgi:RNA 3'-terminal phosphate cyclase (ATP)
VWLVFDDMESETTSRTGMKMVEVDGALYSGSGTIVRQAVALSALTSRPVHIVNARQRRTKPGLRHQHVRAVEAIRELVNGAVEGCTEGSTELTFNPGASSETIKHYWDIGSAGSTTMLALAVLPVLAFSRLANEAVIEGGLFQDNAPTFFHLRHALLPTLNRIGVDADIEMVRPGYVPAGHGVIRLKTRPVQTPLRPLILKDRGDVEAVWGIALSSHLRERAVSQRLAETARRGLLEAGYSAAIEEVYDESALQRGAALAVFADSTGGSRIGADRAGAPRRSSEAIGAYVVRQLLQDLATNATLDRYASDQVIIYAALAEGESRFRIPMMTSHIEANSWLTREFLGAEVRLEDDLIVVKGVGHKRRAAPR